MKIVGESRFDCQNLKPNAGKGECRRVECILTVIDRRCAGPRLPHEHDEDQGKTVPHSLHQGFFASPFHERREARFAIGTDCSFVLNLRFDKSNILYDVLVISGKIADIAIHLVGFLLSAFLEQPRRRLLEDGDQQREKATRDELDSHWQGRN